jgi:flagellar biosynthetic protein FliQ
MLDSHILLAFQQMLYYTALAICLITIPTLVVGFLISIFQAATQISEMTLTFIPKLMTVFAILFLFSPWLMHQLVLWTQFMLTHLPEYIR